MTIPFVIFGLPRSRTAWLSSFLTYRDWRCCHEVAITMRSTEDIALFFRQPRIGAAETAAAPGWRLLRHLVPELRSVVVRRPVDEVVEAMLAVDISGVSRYDPDLLARNMHRVARSLDRIAAQPDVLTVDYADLDREEVCAAIFEYCLPFPHDHAWWAILRRRNIQADVRQVLRYYAANRDAVERFKLVCKSEIRRLAYAGAITNRVSA